MKRAGMWLGRACQNGEGRSVPERAMATPAIVDGHEIGSFRTWGGLVAVKFGNRGKFGISSGVQTASGLSYEAV